MLPHRGLRPHQISAAASKQSLLPRPGVARRFSSLPLKKPLSTLPGRSSTLQTTNWRAGAPLRSNIRLPSPTVRYGSWYAPWTWGGSSSKPDISFSDAHVPATGPTSPADVVAKPPEPAVTSTTPELAPAGIDKTAVVDSESTASDSNILVDMLGHDPTDTPADTAVVDSLEPISYWGNMKDLGLDFGWGTTSFFQSLVELTYLNLDMGWAGSIITSALILRCIMFFGFQRRTSDSMAKIAAMKPLLQPLMDEMEEAKRRGDEGRASTLKTKQGLIMKEVGGDTMKNLGLTIAQVTFGFGAFRCLRDMAKLPVPGLSSESLLWINDLTVPDPYYIVPAMVGGIMYTVMKTGGEAGINTNATVTSMQKNLVVAMPVMMSGITIFQPAALQLYFLTSAALGAVTGYSLRQPAVRRILRIRPLPSDKSHQIYNKVVKGEMKLEQIRGADGKVRYQAPKSTRRFTTAKSSSSTPFPRNVKATFKPGLTLPPHMAPPPKMATSIEKELMDRDHDFDDGMPEGISEKWDWVKRNYRPSFVAKRAFRKITGNSTDPSVLAERRRKEKAREAAARYEVERKRRFEGR